jgi:release factor glutamine methyltransferase
MPGLHVQASDSVRHALTVMTAAFEAAGIENASKDARFILQGILKRDAASLIGDPDQVIGEWAQALQDAAKRRLRHEPVSRILGTKQFYGRQFVVTPDVLDPRPDTECLVDLVLDILRAEDRLSDALTIADIGTGSGAIIVTLLAELPKARGIATDVSAAALAVARKNAAALGVLDRLTFVEANVLAGVNDQIDVIVSNPPYICSAEIAGLDIDVRNYDPHLALDGGTDGLKFYREIANEIRAFRPPCWIALEVGCGQASDVEAIFSTSGCSAHVRRKDLGGHIRAVALQHHR